MGFVLGKNYDKVVDLKMLVLFVCECIQSDLWKDEEQM